MIWRDIPGFSRYQASNTGLIRSKNTGRLQTIFPKKSTKGTYLNCTAIDDNGKRNCTTGVHVLVCLAFHGEQPIGYRDVNHIDGNKHNNHENNLEWSTRANNISHSYRNRERLDSQVVIVTDNFTEKETCVFSMAELAKMFNLSHLKGDVLITDKPYMNRWSFKLKSDYIPPNRQGRQECFAINPATKKLYACNSMTEMALMLTVSKQAVAIAIRDKKPINGFFIVTSETELTEDYIDRKTALSSMREYARRTLACNKRNNTRLCVYFKSQGWVLCDGWIMVNRLLVENGLPFFPKHSRSDVTRLIRDGNVINVLSTKMMRAYPDKDCYYTTLPTITVKDNRTGVTENFPNIDVFAERFEIDKDSIHNNTTFTVTSICI